VPRNRSESFLLVCADALRPDYLGGVTPEGRAPVTPHLEAFAVEANGSPTAYTAATWTLPSHMSFFTGLHPHQHGYGVGFQVGRRYPLPTHLQYLPAYLSGQGIPTFGFHNGGVMEPDRALGHGWTSYVGSPPGEVEGPVQRFLEALPELPRPCFVFVHTYAVHNYWGECETPLPVDYLGEGERELLQSLLARWKNLRWLMAASLRGEAEASEETVEVIRRVYLGAVSRFDALFGQMLSALRTTGREEECHVLLISDHGEALGERHGPVQYWSHMTTNVHEENIRVPFLLRDARGRRALPPEPISLVDLPNTVATCLNLPPTFPGSPPGRRFVTGATEQFGAAWERALPASQRAYRSALLEGNQKYLFVGDDFAPCGRYDLAADPRETLCETGGEEMEEARARLAPFVTPVRPLRTEADESEAAVAEQLRGLGYVD
jgi:arylsulfatase A-like enzyme